MLLTIIVFIIILSLLVFVHELGHFMVARKFGVQAEEFGFGFPPRIWGIYKNQENKWQQVWGGGEAKNVAKTIYSLNWLPLGGFVKIKGENGENPEEQDSFASRPIWQRSIMLAAGVLMNFLLAMILIIIGFKIGLPQIIDQVDSRAVIADKKFQIVQILDNSPAAQANLKIGDTIISIDNHKFSNFEELQKYVDSQIGKKLIYQIKRSQQEFKNEIIPQSRPETGKGGIGIAIAETGLVSYPWHLAIWQGIKTSFLLVWAIVQAFYQLFKGLILGLGVTAELAGPVGIAVLTGEVARMGFIYILQFTALLSLNLAVINFIPFPALDGGRFLFLLIERFRGLPIKREVENFIHNIGFILLMLLVLLVTFRDVSRLGDIGDKLKMLYQRIFG